MKTLYENGRKWNPSARLKFNRKSEYFPRIDRSGPDRWSRGMKTTQKAEASDPTKFRAFIMKWTI